MPAKRPRPLPRATAVGERDGFKLRGGRPALDLPATLAGRRRAEPRELLRTPADLGRWLVAAGLAARPPAVTAAHLAQARELREALYRLALACVRRRPLAAGDRALLNRWAAEPPPAPQLGRGGVSWIGAGVPALLAAVARDGVELFGGPLAPRIRGCAGTGCALLFLDTSRAGARRWCSMAGCGNRAKVKGFRRRLQSAGGR
ncbi:MAG TPA: ABATE domain-containing protein [Thermoanaerobaculia bacterium]|jgi:predicted RNA-binding Zn ribbon-like protein|nr:ABATE domain-containing protein [Thermoanaerobaculia bacterium]